METQNIREVLREYLADGGSRDVYNGAIKELAALKKAAEHRVQADLPSATTGCKCRPTLESYNACPVHGTANR